MSVPDEAAASPRDATVACARCGATGFDPLTWSSSADRPGRRWYCARCSRDNVRAIEGRLDQEWWS